MSPLCCQEKLDANKSHPQRRRIYRLSDLEYPISTLVEDDPRWMEPQVPDEAECMQLWEQYAMPPHIGRHSRAVAEIAAALARRSVALGLADESLIDLAYSAGLLHDIAKAWSVKYGGSHAQMGASWMIAATGHRRLAQAIYHHVGWPWALPNNMASGRLAPTFLVMYADKRVKHDVLVGIEERFDDLLIRYGKNDKSRAFIQNGRNQIRTIERVLSAQLEFSPHESTFAGGRLVN